MPTRSSSWRVEQESAAVDASADHSSPHQLQPLRSISEQLHALGCRTVLIQHPVVDRDFQAEFKTFYATTFSDYSRYSKRLHFFTAPLNKPGEYPLDFIDRVHLEPTGAPGQRQTPGYLGYLNLRPVRSCPVGRTVIAPPSACRYLTVRDSFRSTLAGCDFWITGTPFMQQDSAVGACAHAAIWMALRTTRRVDGKAQVTVAEIAEAATRELVFGRVLPSAGLALNNMLTALERFGYHGELLNFRDAEAATHPRPARIRRSLYPYLESGIPIIALSGGSDKSFAHAVVVVGHGWNERAERTDEKAPISLTLSDDKVVRLHSPTLWIDHLYVNNDAGGPYGCFDAERPVLRLQDVRSAMPLLPKDVYMSAEQALEAASRALIGLFDALLQSELGLTASDLDHRFVLRHYLTSRHEFRKWAIASQSPAMKRYYRQKHLPEKLWVVELNLFDGYYKSGPDAQGAPHRVGELLLDPTGDPHDFPVLAMHINLKRLIDKAVGVLVNVTFHPLRFDLIRMDETVDGYSIALPHRR